MKKGILIVSISIIAFICLFFNVKALTAYADDDTILDVSVKYITAEDADGYNNMPSGRLKIGENPIQEGDYAVSLMILNNTVFAATGYRIEYHSALCSPITYTDPSNNQERPVYYIGNVLNEAGILPYITYDQSLHYLSMGTTSTTNATQDGLIVTYFLHPTHELSLTEEKHLIQSHTYIDWMDASTNDIAATSNNGYTLHHYVSETNTQYWIIGDIDHDGYITAADAQMIYILYTDYTVTGDQIIYTAEYIGTYIIDLSPSSPVTVDAIYVATVCDVNGDGVIDVEDAMDVLTYYTTYVTGQGNLNDYTGIIGTSTGLYTEYSVTFS